MLLYIESLELLLTEKRAKYHKTCFHKYYMKKKHSSEGGFQKVERSRAQRKSSTETVAPVECFLWRERKGFVKNVKKQKQSQKLHAAGEYHTRFRRPNVQHVASLTEQWREMASLLGNA